MLLETQGSDFIPLETVNTLEGTDNIFDTSSLAKKFQSDLDSAVKQVLVQTTEIIDRKMLEFGKE